MSDVRKPIDCPATHEGQRDLVPLYLAGKLADEEAEAFEAHYFGCGQCREDVRAGAELREHYGKDAVAASASASAAASAAVSPASPRRSWLPLAAAVAIAVLGLGVWLSRRAVEQPGQPVLRGPSAGALVLKIEAGPQGGIALSWPAHPAAAAYEVQVFSTDGTRVWSQEVSEPRLSIGPGILPAPEPGKTLEVEVQALDAMRQVVASSDPTPLGTP